MTEKIGRKTENVGRKTTMTAQVQALEHLRQESLTEAAQSVRQLGRLLDPTGNAISQNHKVAQKTGLPVTTVEAYRAKKRQSVPGHIMECLRQLLDAHVAQQDKQVRHENYVLRTKLAAAHAALTIGSSDPEFHCNEADRVREQFVALGGDETAVGRPDRPVD